MAFGTSTRFLLRVAEATIAISCGSLHLGCGGAPSMEPSVQLPAVDSLSAAKRTPSAALCSNVSRLGGLRDVSPRTDKSFRTLFVNGIIALSPQPHLVDLTPYGADEATLEELAWSSHGATACHAQFKLEWSDGHETSVCANVAQATDGARSDVRLAGRLPIDRAIRRIRILFKDELVASVDRPSEPLQTSAKTNSDGLALLMVRAPEPASRRCSYLALGPSGAPVEHDDIAVLAPSAPPCWRMIGESSHVTALQVFDLFDAVEFSIDENL